ncbi:MAG: DUF167 domain-containing protein [Planctomycetia bacterium]|nr:DUF167 domain-containing protein [Planctomycetia bacterium]
MKKPEEISDTSLDACATALEERREGIWLLVKAQPGASKNELRGLHEGMLKVCVTQAPEKGKANKAIIETLAKGLKLRKSQIELVSGELQSQKKFLVTDVTFEELCAKLAAALGE